MKGVDFKCQNDELLGHFLASCTLFGWLEKRLMLMLMLIYYERKTLLFC
jgi:hypothetical protein